MTATSATTDQQNDQLRDMLTIPWSPSFIPIKPTPKQLAFLMLSQREALYGGAVGGGKSVALLAAALQYVDVPGYSALIIRRTLTDLESPGCLIPLSHEWLGDTDAKWHGSRREWKFPSGAKLKFGYLDTPDDKHRYQGGEYAFIGFDELGHILEENYLYLFSRLRVPRDLDVPPRMRATANPDGRGFDWVRSRFIDADDPDRIFIPAGLDDNPHLDGDEYRESLAHLDPVTQQKLINGDWSTNLRKGTLFEKEQARLIDPEDVPPADDLRLVRYWDFAATKPHDSNRDPDYCVGLLMGIDDDDRYWILDVQRFRDDPDQVEHRIKEVATKDGPKVPIVLEMEPGSQSKISHSYFARKVLAGYDVHSSKPSRNKEERARPLASQWRQRNVYIQRAPWNDDFLNELEAFPHARHDDQVDAASGAFGHLVGDTRANITYRPIRRFW